MDIQVLKDRNVGYTDAGIPKNVYVFACKTISDLPGTTFTDNSGSDHEIALGSAAWIVGSDKKYAFDGDSWSESSSITICL